MQASQTTQTLIQVSSGDQHRMRTTTQLQFQAPRDKNTEQSCQNQTDDSDLLALSQNLLQSEVRQKLHAQQQFQIPIIPQMPQPQNINSTGPINKQPRGKIIVGSQQPRPPSVPNNEIQLVVNSPSERGHTHIESQPSSPSLLPQVPQQTRPVKTANNSKGQNNQNETIRHNSIIKSVDGARVNESAKFTW